MPKKPNDTNKPQHKQNQQTKDYEVGYQKPPKHTQFQKGQSGNPKGRPSKKPSIDLESVLKKVFGRLVDIQEGGQQKQITYIQALLTQYANNIASNPSSKDLEFILKHFPVGQKQVYLHKSSEHDQAILQNFAQHFQRQATQTNESKNESEVTVIDDLEDQNAPSDELSTQEHIGRAVEEEKRKRHEEIQKLLGDDIDSDIDFY